MNLIELKQEVRRLKQQKDSAYAYLKQKIEALVRDLITWEEVGEALELASQAEKAYYCARVQLQEETTP